MARNAGRARVDATSPARAAPDGPPRVTRRIAAACVAAGVLLAGSLAGIGWYGSELALHPAWYRHRKPIEGLLSGDGDWPALSGWQGVTHNPNKDLGLAYETVEFPAVDDTTLRGWFVPSESDRGVSVVTVHGGGSDRREFLRQVPFLHDAGYPVLLFDCREQGISDGTGRGIGLGFREHHDVSAAVRYMKDVRGFRRVAVMGTSQGAAAAILAAAADPTIDAVIAENPYTSVHDLIRESSLRSQPAPDVLLRFLSAVIVWRLAGFHASEPIDVVGAIAPRPLFLMHGTADQVVPARQSEALFERAGEPKELWVIDGADHSELFNRDPAAYRARVLAFLAHWLTDPKPPPESSGQGSPFP